MIRTRFGDSRTVRERGPAMRRRGFVGRVEPLEQRELLFFSIAATAVPNVLFPPNGRLVPVVVSGTMQELKVVGSKLVFEELPGPKTATFQVTDEYRLYQASGSLALTNQGKGVFAFSVTIPLQASRSGHIPAGRRYYIALGGADSTGVSDKTIPVWVPESLTPPVSHPKAAAVTPATGHPHGPHGRRK